MALGGPISIREVDPASPEWDGLITRFADHTIFHSSVWLSIVQAAHGVRPVCVEAEQAGHCIGVWPYLEKRKGPFRAIGSPLPGWSTAYMGPLIAEDADVPATLRAFLDHKSFKRYAYFACRTLIHRHDVDLAPFGFDLLTKFETYWIDLLETEEALWGNLKSECRSRVRKAEKEGVEIRRETDDSFLDDFWGMSGETFAKSHIQPTHTREFCIQVWRKLSPLNRVYVLSAFVSGRRAAILILPFDSQTMYYWGGASYQEFREVPVNNLLHWRAIRDAKALGLKRYDFVSSEGGPGRFKKTFGPKPVDLARHWERSPSWLLRTLKNRYQAYLMKKRRVENE
ncbi:MAG TPA: GNAT family N-acetyltransferase [Phycisphaerales bacterium]|nr:GNAT family N-acetyltransferase [Phycisphaerales bacterium]